MEVDEIEMSRRRRQQILPTMEELKAFLALKPPLKGKVKIIEDRPLVGHNIRVIDAKALGGIPPGGKEPTAGRRDSPTLTIKPELAKGKVPTPVTIPTNGPLLADLKTASNKNKRKKERRREKRREEARKRDLENLDLNPRPGTDPNTPLPPPTQSSRQNKPTSGPSREVHTPQKREDQPEWTRVIGRKEQRRTKTMDNMKPNAQTQARGNTQKAVHLQQQGKEVPKTKAKIKRPPRTAAIVITSRDGSYADIMKKARSQISPEEFGAKDIKPRRARTGALLLEIPGPDNEKIADNLAQKMREILNGQEGVVISRPIKTTEIRVRDIEDSISVDEVVESLAASGGCTKEGIKVGPIRRAPNGLGSAWARCPLAAASQILKTGKIKLGWVVARVEPLNERPLLCYKCLGKGHVRAACTSIEDRSNMCYRCGEAGHRANECTAQPKCPVCSALGKPANHRVGGGACKAPQRGGPAGGRTKRGIERGVELPPKTQDLPPSKTAHDELMEVETLLPQRKPVQREREDKREGEGEVQSLPPSSISTSESRLAVATEAEAGVIPMEVELPERANTSTPQGEDGEVYLIDLEAEL